MGDTPIPQASRRRDAPQVPIPQDILRVSGMNTTEFVGEELGCFLASVGLRLSVVPEEEARG